VGRSDSTEYTRIFEVDNLNEFKFFFGLWVKIIYDNVDFFL
jgi:hypothetical protein